MGINPWRGNGDTEGMYQDWESLKRGEVIPWRQDGWGCAFGNLHSLKELQMEFETSEDKLAELENLVEIAKAWRFPLEDGKFLSTEGLEEKKWIWRGPVCYWSPMCPYCHRIVGCPEANKKCAEKRRLKARGLGPVCTVVSLRWRVADAAS